MKKFISTKKEKKDEEKSSFMLTCAVYVQLHYLQDAEAHLLTARAQTTARKQKKKQIQQKHYLQQITTSSQIITLTHSTQTP